jgi:ubiquinone/menaquinone biosynthesis C-methylase UbiE
VPPRRMIFIGNGDYLKTGEEFLKYFTDLGSLQPHHFILDIGCGIGRMSVPLTRFLGANGRYEGFDIVSSGIQWCQKNISPRFTNFRYQVADIQNKMYNPSGTFPADQYKFPFSDNHFDFAFATSVFTHMFPNQVDNYVKEIFRTLKPGGGALLTFFLLNNDSLSLMKTAKSTLSFAHPLPDCFTVDKEIPETAIGFHENFIRNLFIKSGFTSPLSIHFGSWCGRSSYLSYQDIILIKK